MRTVTSGFAAILAFAAIHSSARATIIVNPSMPIDRELVVQLIQAREDNGTNAATVFGNAAQRLSIENALDQIWAQAGINITVLATITPYSSSFALDRNDMTTGDRPTADFDTIFVQASAAGVLNNGNVINAIFLDYVPGFSLLSESFAAGLASINGKKITMFAGQNLLGFPDGLDVIASVFAHEIGHNLGLSHIVIGGDNLMEPGGSTQRLTASQISTARSSSLLTVIPEPGTGTLILLSAVLLTSSCGQFTRRAFRH
jgi:hypothetical protein